MLIYLDTSALAKWYLNEPGSEAFVRWIQQQNDVHISSLTSTEMRCLLSRRKRRGDISSELEHQVFAAFLDDIERGHLSLHPLAGQHTSAAIKLINQLPQHALRTLDAMHLAIARSIGAEAIATSDHVMISAAESLHLKIIQFD